MELQHGYIILDARFCNTAPDDYTEKSGSFDITDTAMMQCVSIPITSDSVDEPEEKCFTFTITSVSSVPGLTLSPNVATVCISDEEREW